MTEPSRTRNPRTEALVGLAATGIVFLAIGFALWFALLAAELVSTFAQSSRHMHQHGYRPFSLLASDGGVAVAYSAAFFFAAFLLARVRWRYRSTLSVATAYAVFLCAYLPALDWSRGFTPDTFSLFVPLITSPLGALLGERLFPKPQNPERGHAAKSHGRPR